MRVEVKIPGGVEAYVIDLRGERYVSGFTHGREKETLMIMLINRHEATSAIWQEVYLSAMLRAILYADDANYVRVFFPCLLSKA